MLSQASKRIPTRSRVPRNSVMGLHFPDSLLIRRVVQCGVVC